MAPPSELLDLNNDTGVCGRILELLESEGARFRLLHHAPEGRTDVASRLRGHPLNQAAKCIVVRVKITKRSSRYVLAVVPGDRLVDLEGIRRLYGGKDVSFAQRDTAEELAGAVCGSITPFSFHPDLEAVVDPELLRQEEIFFNAARLDLSVALNSEDYVSIARPRIEAVALNATDAFADHRRSPLNWSGNMTILDTTTTSSVKPAAVRPPNAWGNEPGEFLKALNSPWYKLVADLQDLIHRTTAEYATSRGLKALYLPLTVRTITCPTGLGSDSEPVPVTVNGVDTYLPDSNQFMLEYGMRLAPGGCYNIMPSFRGEEPDTTHLNQYSHSEAEIPGGIDELIDYVEGYVKALAGAALEAYGDRIAAAAGDTSHLSRMAEYKGHFPRITFEEAVSLLEGEEGCVRDEGTWRTLTRRGEHKLMEMVNEFMWVTHFDHLSVPFYQAFGDEEQRTAANADLFFGMGEVVGSGERHSDAEQIRKALVMHQVPERDYAWYAEMKQELPMRTSGFGMGLERFLMWVLNHDDIRDIPLVSRVGEDKKWPESVHRP
ncbi:amino acid--tRNA ligase-related protein [Streptomyces sp. PKU-EA00015]|uniref:amino acid--tRNA ligase-related protein n=1 Tax=Streptomyces sp. PKU-EA00015 TaxID=2748326 RepID=UPI001C432335|nr:amino acid--tRNA ligase-related protein [Streptomyces sp. PKU-EA00015]